MLLVAITTHSLRFDEVSCVLVWAASFALEVASPFQPSAILNRVCTNMEASVACVVGLVEIGSRLVTLVRVQVAAIGLSWVAAVLTSNKRNDQDVVPVSVAIPAMTQIHLVRSTHDGFYDYVGCVLSGLLPFQISVFVLHVCRHKPSIQGPLVSQSNRALQLRDVTGAAAYVVVSVVSSILFFYTSQGKLANYFLWPGFNSPGSQADRHKQRRAGILCGASHPRHPQPQRQSSRDVQRHDDPSSNECLVRTHTLQLEAFSLAQTIAGLRANDPCQLPWVFTRPCFVDFTQLWSVANSAARVTRCTRMATNAALFLEAGLCNSDWDVLQTCWLGCLSHVLGSQFGGCDCGRAADVQRRPRQSTAAALKTMFAADEAQRLAPNHGITEYQVQWQNYKQVGVIETIDISNVFDFAYPVTLKASSGTFALMPRSSCSCTGAGAAISGPSLRSIDGICRPQFDSLKCRLCLCQHKPSSDPRGHGTLGALLTGRYGLFGTAVGPFGSSTCCTSPPLLAALVDRVKALVRAGLASNASAQVPAVLGTPTLGAMPWLMFNWSQGGSPLCQTINTRWSSTLLSFFGQTAGYSITQELMATSLLASALGLLVDIA
ncbi:Aste57867_12305 [Aphanomyces stellatus]|uniref:Aste57867_12305 protein n=1 Tax=Aphanomyces stellatus TaxID=120398 RepID=A0A485KV60_9STRA|nr:hypothetical protein As57867_012259 [Aphanomyces stellatus]VFT89157.1 Aste57867_12305 [Aphanomyces stellatus]